MTKDHAEQTAADKPSLSYLGSTLIEDDSLETMIEVDHVSMIFNMASEQLNSLKEYAISLARRELHFKEFRALDDISLTVKRGDVFGIMGTNGSGKSTLLKIIAGVLEPSEGTCSINGTIAPLIELGAGFDIELTARENIYLNGALLGYPKQFIDEHFDEIVAFAEIEPFLDMPLKNYSSGMVARVAFAIATVIVPDILIVDEVLSVGDFMFQQKCERRIQSLIRDHGVTVLIVSHNSDQVERLCNKAIWIEKGHTRMIGSANEVCDIYRSIGGRIGSKESETIVYEAMRSSCKPDESMIRTFTGENRFSLNAQLYQAVNDDDRKTRAVIAPGEDESASLIGTALAASLECELLLVKRSAVPDVIANSLRKGKLEDLYIVGSDSYISDSVVQELEELTHATVHRISGNTLQDLSLSAYQAGEQYGNGWGETAVVTYDGCIGDVASLMPFIYQNKAPLFVCAENGCLSEEIGIFFGSERFSRLISLGDFSFESIESCRNKSTKVMKVIGSSAFDASQTINAWELENGVLFEGEMIIGSVWNLHDTLALGAYAKLNNALVWLEDPQHLDSIASTIRFIEEHAAIIDRLTFLGDETRFTKNDRIILGKTLQTAKMRLL